MNNALEIKDLVKVYTGGTKALNGISLNVKVGDFYALLGPNGAGKSSTIGIIGTLVTKTSGSVKIFDKDIDINTHNPEFLDWKWIELDQLTKVVVDFKLHVYKEVQKKVEKLI